MTHLYSCKSETHPDGDNYRITKFDADMNVESSYQIALDGSWCMCPAGERSTCRHREMLPKFIAKEAINSFWLFDYDRNGWVSMENSNA